MKKSIVGILVSIMIVSSGLLGLLLVGTENVAALGPTYHSGTISASETWFATDKCDTHRHLGGAGATI